MIAINDKRGTNLVIDLGCGEAKVPGAVGLDNVKLPSVDVEHDLLDFPYPFHDNAASEIYLNHVLEHFPLPDAQSILNEAHRILVPGGKVHIRVPHVFSAAAWIDPTHRTYYAFESGRFFDSSAPKSYYKELDCSWQLTKVAAQATWFNWKRYRLKKMDAFFSRFLVRILNWLLGKPNMPGSADMFVQVLPIFFVEIQWDLRKS